MTRSYIALFLALSASYLGTASDDKAFATPQKNNDLEA
jgi:hypothetical protein